MKNKRGESGGESEDMIKWILWISILLAVGTMIFINLKKIL